LVNFLNPDYLDIYNRLMNYLIHECSNVTFLMLISINCIASLIVMLVNSFLLP